VFSPFFCFRVAIIVGAVWLGGTRFCAAAQITSGLSFTTWLGTPTQYQIASDNQPVSFDATNLAPGLSLDRATGVISGVPSISGAHYTEVVAHGQSGDAGATVIFIVYVPAPADDPHSGGFGVDCISMLADPHRPRLYCGGANQELVVIDTDAMSILTRIPNTGYIIDLSISPDGQTLWCVRTYYYNSLARINLETLDALIAVPTSPPVESALEGLDHRLYAAARGTDLLQLDPATGAVQHQFRPDAGPNPASGLTLAMSPDRRTLYVGDAFYVDTSLVSHSAVSRYDISTATPVFLQRVEMPTHRIQSMAAVPDGNSIYLVLGTFDGFGSRAVHQALCLAANDLTVTKGTLSFHGTATNSITISADGTRALIPVELGNGGELTTGLVNVFDTENFQLIKSVVLGTRNSVFVGDVVSDRTGSSLFVATDLNPKLRVYPMPFLPPPPVTPPNSLLNISTRMLAQNGDNVLIGGFVVTGSDSKQVVLRAIGPSLPFPGKLGDPVLELHGPNGAVIAENDNWNSHRAEILAAGIPPDDEYEAAILATLPAGAYTAILRGVAGSSGIAVFEAYDLNGSANSRLANISTRGKVETGDNVMIGGWIIGGGLSTNIAVRAIGPSLANGGVDGALADPTLGVYNGSGVLVAQNDDWRTYQEQALIVAGLAPQDDRESAILVSVMPGNYTAIVRGKDDRTGVALVEVYNLQ
jgi:hypothetical protein